MIALESQKPSLATVVRGFGIEKVFGEGANAFHALQNISLSLSQGQLVAVVGPSGCGKSTLMQIIAGLTLASGGRVEIDGQAITTPQPDRVGVVFQEPLLLSWKTAIENIEFPLSLGATPAVERRQRARELLDLVGLEDFGEHYPHQLSGGMRQRVAIARGLVRNPRVLLMDEPFGGLDEQTRTRMWGELLRIHERSRTTILFITHSLIEAVFLADQVLVMATRPGRIIERIDVDLPRPRDLKLLGSERLGAIRNRIWDLISEPTV
jgi:NitT/TauT family transport system ATP-binding protein